MPHPHETLAKSRSTAFVKSSAAAQVLDSAVRLCVYTLLLISGPSVFAGGRRSAGDVSKDVKISHHRVGGGGSPRAPARGNIDVSLRQPVSFSLGRLDRHCDSSRRRCDL